MAFVNMFNDRVEQFNLREENERLAELFSDEKLQEEAQWQAYSVKEISRLFSISEEEALKLMNCGLFKTYRVGNEYRASKKSVEENKKIVKAVLTYQDKKTMSVPDVMRILGLGKTATYRLINQCRFKTYLVLGKMRVDVDSFEDWYAGQFHYEKVNGERPGKKYGKTLSPLTVAKVLGIPRSTANDLKLSQEERRTRSHRLVVRGAVFESIVPEAKTMTDEEAAAFLRLALTSEEARAYLKKRTEGGKSE